MKKGIIVALLAAVFLVGTQNGSMEKVLANENVQQVVEWVNNLGRKPEDPAYLTLNYRMRRIYFSALFSVMQKRNREQDISWVTVSSAARRLGTSRFRAASVNAAPTP